jgi:branched-chain amino acid transport system substrate-binding protein
MTPAGSVDVSTEVIKLRRAAPDYTIFHGYILAPIPEFITQGKQQGMTSKWMGTFWTMDSSTVMKMGEAGDGFMGVMPYRYYYDTEKAPMLEKIRALRPSTRARLHPGLSGRHAVRRIGQAHAGRRQAAHRRQPQGRAQLHQGLRHRRPDWRADHHQGNSIPVGRVYRADMKAQKMVAASDWIRELRCALPPSLASCAMREGGRRPR